MEAALGSLSRRLEKRGYRAPARAQHRRHDEQVTALEPQASAQGGKALQEVAQQFDVHPNPNTQWRARLLESSANVFGGRGRVRSSLRAGVRVLRAGIGTFDSGKGFFVRCARKGQTVAQRKAMTERSHALLVAKQACQLGAGRVSVHCLPRPLSAIIYRPVARGFVYHVAFVDSFSRRVLAWREWMARDARFSSMSGRSAGALRQIRGLQLQRSQFARPAFTGVRGREKIAISIEGRNCWRDKVSVKRLAIRPITRRSTVMLRRVLGRTRVLVAARPQERRRTEASQW